MKTTFLLSILFCLSFGDCWAQLLPDSDEFNRACSMENWKSVNVEECWNATHLEVIDIDLSHEDKLTLMPWTTAWYGNYRSNLLYKEVSGNFAYTILVSATNRAGDNIPSSLYSLAGAMVRAPLDNSDCGSGWTTGQEDYVFLSLGFAAGNNPPHFEVKSTINSNSNLNITSIPVAEAHIKLLRIDNAVIALHQVTGESWQIRERFDRADLPDTLMVGNVAYTDWNKVNDYQTPFHNRHTINALLDPDPATSQDTFAPDIIAQFDYSRFETIVIPPALQGLDFANENEVSDSTILALFAYVPASQDVQGWKIWKGHSAVWNDTLNWSDHSIPTAMDSIIIPNCNCDDVLFPEIQAGQFQYASLVIEEGGQLQIAAGARLEIDLSANSCRFDNFGTITNAGEFVLSNMQNKSVINRGNIETTGTGISTFGQ